MPVFATPEPVAVTVELAVGTVRIAATDRTDTVVDVRPTDPADESDVKAAAQVSVDFDNGRLRITAPRRVFDFSRRTKSVDVTVELPTGSGVSADVQAGDIHATGRLGESRIKTAIGNVTVERTGPLRVHTSMGHVTADGVNGDADVSSGTGRIEIGEIDGAADVKNSNGDTALGTVSGNARVRAANGSIRLGRAGADVDAKSSNGSVRIGEVVRGSVVLDTAMGDVEVGIAEGTAAWLQVNTAYGQVRNEMDTALRPDGADHTVEVRGRTTCGDVTVRRA